MTTTQLQHQATIIRKTIITMLAEAGSGHSAGALGMADVFTALYLEVLTHRPKQPTWELRDRVVVSNGHIAPVVYATMAQAGYFYKSELSTLRQLGSRLQGHPHRLALPGIETSSGPLGQGLSQAIGMAMAAHMDGKHYRTYCIMSDAEQQEGQTWEAVMFAGNKRLSNLCAVIDRNNIQIDGPTEDVMPLEPLRKKYEAFNWHVIEIDGNNMRAVVDAFDEARAIVEKPTLILAHTIPGKGVKFMESDFRWHGQAPTKQQAAVAIKQLSER